MTDPKDFLVWKLDKDLARARLALAKIYTIIDKIPFWNIEIKEIDETLHEYFDYDKRNGNA